MIIIEIKDYSISVSGHAGYAKKGQDIVCAAISAIVQSSSTWFTSKDAKYIQNDKENAIQISLIKKNESNNQKLELLIKQLKFIQKQYKKYIKIIRR